VGAGTTDDLQAAIRELELEQIELNRLRKESEDLAARITGMLDEVESSTAEYESARKSAEQKLGALIRAEEERRAAAALAEYQRQQAEANAGNSGGSGSSSGGSGSNSAAQDLIANYPAPSGMAGVAVTAALGQIGVPYRYATALPGTSFDCSGLTYYAWAQAGVVLPRNSRMQSNALPSVPKTDAKPGDLIFYYNPISHVGLYLGDGQMVHAPALGKTVSITSVNWSKVVDVGRPG
jgi:cell wall-associated NlpC family hydrolase